MTGLRDGAMGFWHDQLWYIEHDQKRIETFDGTTYRPGAKLPTDYKPWRAMFTDSGMFLFAREPLYDADGTVKLHLLRSPDGYQPFTELLSRDVTSSTQLKHSFVDLGQGRLLYVHYGDDSLVSYSDDNGDHWKELFRPDLQAVRHFHGAVYDADFGKLYLMSGDGDSQSSIMVTDDLFGPQGLINDPQLWVNRWGLSDPKRSTMDKKYFLQPDGVATSQRTRSVDMLIEGDYLYYGEDTGSDQRQSIYRVNRQTQAVERIGARDIIGAPWTFLHTSSGELIFTAGSIEWNGELIDGHDQWMRLYALNDDRTDYREIAKFPRKQPFYDTATSIDVIEAFGKIWVNGYEVPQDLKDIVGTIVQDPIAGDLDANRALDVNDVQILTRQMRANRYDVTYDINHDDALDDQDLFAWVHDIKHTWIGDANLDGVFNSEDLVSVLVAGEYEDHVTNNSTWGTGDWDGDGEFTSNDLIAALADGRYEQGASAARALAVPEPSAGILAVMTIVPLVCRRSRRV